MFDKDLEEIRHKVENTIPEMKNTLEEINMRLTEQENKQVTWKTEWWK